MFFSSLSYDQFFDLKSVTLKSEFDSVSPWYSIREMEENMVGFASFFPQLTFCS